MGLSLSNRRMSVASSMASRTSFEERRNARRSTRKMSWKCMEEDDHEYSLGVVDRWTEMVVAGLTYSPLEDMWCEICAWDSCEGASEDSELPASGRNSMFSNLSLSSWAGSSSSMIMQAPDKVMQHSCHQQPACVLHPGSKVRMSWDLLGAFFLLHDVFIIPMQIFDREPLGWPAPYRTVLQMAELLAVIFWSIDLVLSFMTGFYTRNGYVEMSPRKIACGYVRSWFMLDCSVTLMDWASIFFFMSPDTDEGQEFYKHLRSGKIVTRITRLLRLLRFMKLNKSLVEHFHVISSENVLAVLTLVRLIGILIVFGHYIACGWYGLSLVGPEDHTWLSSAPPVVHDETDMAYTYLTSLHWSLTQFTPASMEVVPRNWYERAYNIVIILIAMLTFSSFVSSITNTMTHIRKINAERLQEEVVVRRFFAQANISQELASRVWWVLQQKRLHVEMRMKVCDVPSLKLLPHHILHDVLEEAHSPALVRHPLFRCIRDMHPEVLHEICHAGLFERTVPLGELMFGKGVVVNEMFFVLKGSIEYHDDEIEVPDISVDEGGWACEAGLWSSEARLGGPFVAEPGCCELLVLTSARLKELIRDRVSCRMLVARYGAAFMRHFNRASCKYTAANRLFNDRKMLSRIVHSCRLRTIGSKTFTSIMF